MTIGISAFRSAWRRRIARVASPLARATRMKSCPSTSSIDDRVMRTTTAESPSDSDSTGRNICWRLTHGSVHGVT